MTNRNTNWRKNKYNSNGDTNITWHSSTTHKKQKNLLNAALFASAVAILLLLCYIAPSVLHCYCANFLLCCYIFLHCHYCANSSLVASSAAAAGYNGAQRKLERLLQCKIIVMLAIIIPIPTNKQMQKGTKQTNKEKHAVLKKVKTL